MKAISLWQPWASLWLSPAKVHETRGWATRHRGPLAVHAAKQMMVDVSPDLEALLLDEFGGHWAMDLPRGAIIGVVTLTDCIQIDYAAKIAADGDDLACGDWTKGRFAWRRHGFRLLPEPVPYRGQQGLFDVPDELLAHVAGELA